MMEEQHEVESAIPKDIVYNALEYSTGILQDVIQEEEERFYEIQGIVLVCWPGYVDMSHTRSL